MDATLKSTIWRAKKRIAVFSCLIAFPTWNDIMYVSTAEVELLERMSGLEVGTSRYSPLRMSDWRHSFPLFAVRIGATGRNYYSR